MSTENARDPRVTLMREKHFSMRPKPLERWVWQQGLPASAERIYWYHWDLGARNGTWCSQVPLRIVARDCCVDPVTVTRAYQLLKRLGLLRREDPGRDPANPFQQATAITEVRVPRDVVMGLAREPNRRAGRERGAVRTTRTPDTAAASIAGLVPDATIPGRDESRRIFAKLSAGERTRLATASSQRRTTLEFDADTRLGPAERGHVLATLESLARAKPPVAPDKGPGQAVVRPRRLSTLEVMRVDQGLRTLAAARAQSQPARLLIEVVFAAEEGALARFPVPLALNIALKKIREGAWSSPHRMPLEWGLRRALPVPCNAAGQV